MKMFAYSPKTEFLQPDDIKMLQTQLLKRHLVYCQERSPFYREVLKDISIDDISIDDISLLPFTEKEDILLDWQRFAACSPEEVSDIVFTSGSTGKPGRFVYTQQDLLRNSYNEERCYKIAGVSERDTILLTCTLDRCFIAGIAYYTGGIKAGAAVLRNGLSSIESHLWIIREAAPTVIVGIATFLVKLAEHAQKAGIDLGCIQRIICVGEPIKNNDFSFNGIGQRLHELFPHAQLFATYASTEIATSFAECEFHQGGHVPADLAYAEIIDDNGKILPQNIEKFGKCIQKTQEIISELMVSLDMEKGGEIAKNLMSLYVFFNAELMNANISKDKAKIQNIKKMLFDLLGAWNVAVESTAPVSSPTTRLNIDIEG